MYTCRSGRTGKADSKTSVRTEDVREGGTPFERRLLGVMQPSCKQAHRAGAQNLIDFSFLENLIDFSFSELWGV